MMETWHKELALALEALFISRHDSYALQQRDGTYIRIDQPLTLEIIEEHLEGKNTVGNYQLDRQNNVKDLCFDLDPEKLDNPKDVAQRILNVCFEEKEEEPNVKRPRIWPQAICLEASRYSDPSYHIWILFWLSVPAKVAHWLGYRILELAGLNPKQIEVFPKQTELTGYREYGNFVKLPLGKHQACGKWSQLLDFETFEPLPNDVLQEKFGVSFSETDIVKIMGAEDKKTFQIPLTQPLKFKTLSDREEEKTASWLARHWVRGYRNQLEMYFLGLCLKKGVSYASAKRIIESVADRTNDEEKFERLSMVDYHYRNRTNIPLKGKSGIRELLGVFKYEHQQRT